jgi:hypothetical protein
MSQLERISVSEEFSLTMFFFRNYSKHFLIAFIAEKYFLFGKGGNLNKLKLIRHGNS